MFFKFSKKLTEKQFYERKKNIIKQINRDMETVRCAMGVDQKLTTNVARHSYATLLKENAVPIALISENLGHTSITTTANYLASFSYSKTKTTSELLETVIKRS